MTITYVRTADGQQVSPGEALDAHGTLRPGITMRTRSVLMDGRYVPMTDADKDRRRAQVVAYNARIGSAWRDPAAQHHDGGAAKLRDEALAKITNVYERYDARIRDAWR